MIPENKPAHDALAIPLSSELSSRGNARGVIPSLRSFVLVPDSSFKAEGHLSVFLGDPSSAVLSGSRIAWRFGEIESNRITCSITARRSPLK